MPAETGKRFECPEAGAQYMVTRGGDGELSCVAAPEDEADRLGKRYQDAKTGVTVLCIRAGGSRVCYDGAPMELLAAKTLPSSD
ncbi:MAG: hypothetical protein IIC94_09080 [Chloroflexi bacterium]|nr:hypothetical protein [Chloroflexota bacterium]